MVRQSGTTETIAQVSFSAHSPGGSTELIVSFFAIERTETPCPRDRPFHRTRSPHPEHDPLCVNLIVPSPARHPNSRYAFSQLLSFKVIDSTYSRM